MNQEPLLQNEYVAAESRILSVTLPSRLRLRDPERATLAGIGRRVGRKALRSLHPCHLKAMRGQAGVELSVNNSLNVASPIVQTRVPAQKARKRWHGMDTLPLISAEADAFLAWRDVHKPPKDSLCLPGWLRAWRETASPVL